ncbi:unnamed protein product [Urochloa decumbens]|uniref:Cytochrome b5 heme-binding domain-containing protein n=1 Tax=Urochloa decumbens TaxID=240449 RepID=A0ABC9EH67_9POAL
MVTIKPGICRPGLFGTVGLGLGVIGFPPYRSRAPLLLLPVRPPRPQKKKVSTRVSLAVETATLPRRPRSAPRQHVRRPRRDRPLYLVSTHRRNETVWEDSSCRPPLLSSRDGGGEGVLVPGGGQAQQPQGLLARHRRQGVRRHGVHGGAPRRRRGPAGVHRKINSLTQSPPPPSFRAGKDATADFEDIGHSDDAKEMMPQYLIGELDAATVPAKLAYAYASDAGATRSSTGAAGAWATLLRLAVPVLLLALALGMQSYGKAKAE